MEVSQIATWFSWWYRKFCRRWGSTHDFHRFNIWVGFALMDNLWCWELSSYRPEWATAETRAWLLLVFSWIQWRAADMFSLGSRRRLS